jgi:hypothetical protein
MSKTFQRGDSSGNFTRVKLDMDQLEKIQSTLLARYITRVGVLGSKTNRRGRAVNTNAGIGLLHEKGSLSLRIPRRSFLEMPLILKSEELMKSRDALWDEFFVSEEHTHARLRTAYKKLGVIAENIIQKAFETGGYGQWPPDAPSTIRRKGSSAILIDTAQLRKSISSDVVNK